MKYRPNREFLDEALAETKEFETIEELLELIGYVGKELTFRYQGLDTRCNWWSYLVALDGDAVGHTNGIPKGVLYGSYKILGG